MKLRLISKVKNFFLNILKRKNLYLYSLRKGSDLIKKANGQLSLSLPVIFIVGPPRSGTTWLWGLLSTHPDINSITRDQLGLGTSFNKDGSRFSSETGVFLSNEVNDLQIICAFSASKGTNKYVIEKTPHHSFCLERMKCLFPDAYIICMRRNVYDILTSMKYFFLNYTFQDNISEVQRYLNAIENHENLIDMYVDYELLIEKTDKIVDNILNNLDLDNSMTSKIVELNKNRTILKNRNDAFRKGIVGDYKNLNADELKQIELVNWKNSWVRNKPDI